MWPALARFGLHPTDVYRLSTTELSYYVEALKDEQWRNRHRSHRR